jgi:hypothetical protein
VNAAYIFLFAAATPLLMRLKLRSLNALLSRPVVRVPPPDSKRIARTIRLVERTMRFGRPFIVRGCLPRGLTLYYFLRRLGVDVALVFGAGEANHHFAAHCWLEQGSEPWLEKVDPRKYFVPIYRFEKPRADHSV